MIANFYKDDFDKERLKFYQDMFLDIATQRDVHIDCFQSAVDLLKNVDQGAAIANTLPELTKLVRVALTIPVTSCTAERSFSSLRRLKTYLRSTMSQERLNHVAILNYHKDIIANVNINEFADEFISRASVRRNMFAMSLSSRPRLALADPAKQQDPACELM
jgi:hypothetical protein